MLPNRMLKMWDKIVKRPLGPRADSPRQVQINDKTQWMHRARSEGDRQATTKHNFVILTDQNLECCHSAEYFAIESNCKLHPCSGQSQLTKSLVFRPKSLMLSTATCLTLLLYVFTRVLIKHSFLHILNPFRLI